MNQVRDCLSWFSGQGLVPIPTVGTSLAAPALINTQPTAAPGPRVNSTFGNMRDIPLGPRVAWNAINPTSNTTYKSASAFLSAYLYAAGWTVKASGTENIPFNGKMIFAPNHASNWDAVIVTLALTQIGLCGNNALPFVAKQELFNVPGLAWVLTQIGQVPVNRSAAGSDDVLQKMQAKLQQCPVGFFPEGTRTSDGALHRLKTGMMRTAIEGWSEGYPCGKIQMIPVGIIGLAGPQPEWATARYCGRDVEVKFAKPKTIDDLVDGLKEKSAVALKMRFLEWGDEKDDVLELLNQLLIAQDPHALLKENLVSTDSAKQTAAQKILLRWLAQDFAENLAQVSQQNYVDTCVARKSRAVIAHQKVD